MPRTGSGTYVLPSVTPPIQAGASIAAASMNTTLADLATAMTGSVASDGQTPITGNWNFAGKNLSGVNNLGVNALAVTAGVSIGATLGVTGATTLDDTLSVTGATTIYATLTVTGTATAADGTSGDQVVNYGQFPATLAATGTTTLPNGLIMKWGTGSTTLGVGAVVFAAAFPTACRNVQITISGAAGTVTVNPLALGAVTAAGFAVWGDATESFGFNWFAIGH